MGRLMTYNSINQPGNAVLTMRKQSCDNRHPLSLDHSADGFDIWWIRTFAQHAAVVAQASALKRAYQRSSSADKAPAEQAN